MEVCSQNTSDPYTVLLKVNGNKCNMACMYCSESQKKFTKEQCQFDYESIDQILVRLPKDVDIIFHGGEPSLIGIDHVLKMAKRIKELGFSIKPSIQTNGYLSNEWIDFLDYHKDILKVSVSIDGNQECNSYRRIPDFDSNKAFSIVDSFLHQIDERGIDFRCIATINRISWNKGDKIVEYFSQFNHLKFVKLNPCFDIDQGGIKEWAITPNQYLHCLKDAFDAMIELKTYMKFKLDPFMDILNHIERKTNQFAFKCNKFASIFPNGFITSCDAMREVEQEVKISANMFHEFTQPNYTESIMNICNRCENLSLCSGGCPPLMYRYQIYNADLLDEYCNYRVGIRSYIKHFVNIGKGEVANES